jgi:hypothetical protein
MSDVQAESPKTLPKATQPETRRNKPLLSIRARLIVVALLAISPLMVERVRGLERARVERGAIARSQVIDLARSGIAAQREVIDSDARLAARGGARLHQNAARGAGLQSAPGGYFQQHSMDTHAGGDRA